MILNISNKNGKSYRMEIKEELIGKRIGDIIDGAIIGMEGYELEITGGSDKQGFPMRKDIEGQKRVRALLSKGPGFRPKEKGERRRKNVRGKVIAEDISQVNLKIIKMGKKNLEEIFTKKEEEPKE